MYSPCVLSRCTWNPLALLADTLILHEAQKALWPRPLPHWTLTCTLPLPYVQIQSAKYLLCFCKLVSLAKLSWVKVTSLPPRQGHFVLPWWNTLCLNKIAGRRCEHVKGHHHLKSLLKVEPVKLIFFKHFVSLKLYEHLVIITWLDYV